MFIVCGKCENGKVRVLDTRDYIVEIITPEQAQIVKLEGYDVKVNYNYDFMYNLHKAVKERKRLAIYQSLVALGKYSKFYVPDNVQDYYIDSIYVDRMDIAVVAVANQGDMEDAVVYTIEAVDNFYTIHCNHKFILDTPSLGRKSQKELITMRDSFAFCFNIMYGDQLSRIIFNYDCEVIGEV